MAVFFLQTARSMCLRWDSISVKEQGKLAHVKKNLESEKKKAASLHSQFKVSVYHSHHGGL